LANGSTPFRAEREIKIRADQSTVDIELAYGLYPTLHDTEIWLGRANSQPRTAVTKTLVLRDHGGESYNKVNLLASSMIRDDGDLLVSVLGQDVT
jgi:hypothetical protein